MYVYFDGACGTTFQSRLDKRFANDPPTIHNRFAFSHPSRSFIMKKIVLFLAIATGALAAPALSFAQTNGPITRAEVRADLVRVEQAGYNPSVANDINYPADIQAAEAKIAAQDGQQSGTQGYGGVTQHGKSAAGKRASTHTAMQSSCVGPASYCNPYFGS